MPDAEFSVTIEGLDELRKRLRDPQIMEYAAEAMQKSLMAVQAEAARYPNKPAGRDTYVRTGNLGREWTQKIERRRKDLIGTLGSAASSPKGFKYGIVVKGPGTQQGRIFRDYGWKTIEQDFETKRKLIYSLFATAMRRMLAYLAGK